MDGRRGLIVRYPYPGVIVHDGVAGDRGVHIPPIDAYANVVAVIKAADGVVFDRSDGRWFIGGRASQFDRSRVIIFTDHPDKGVVGD